MSVNILVVDDEADAAELSRQQCMAGTLRHALRLPREEALNKLEDGLQPDLLAEPFDIKFPGMECTALASSSGRRSVFSISRCLS